MSNNPELDRIAKAARPGYITDYSDFRPGQQQVLYSGPYWDHREIAAILDNVLHGDWIVSGDSVVEFQQAFAKRFAVAHSHMVNSGSSANLVMITALRKHFGWRDGDEIIVSPVGFPTTIAPIMQNNLRPVFADIEMQTLNFDLDQVEQAISPRTKAIFVSPVLGNPPDMDRLQDICDRHHLLLIGDNCDSLGTQWRDRHIAELYFSWSCSFYPAHHICTGEGGMVSSDDQEFINTVRSISWWGRDCYCVGQANTLSCGTCGRRFSNWLQDYDGIIDHKYLYSNVGYNLKPLDLQGAVGLIQLEKFDEIHARRVSHKQQIQQMLEDHVGTKSPITLPHAAPSWFGTPVVCDSVDQKHLLVSHFESHRIQTRNYFGGNILLHPAYRHLADHRNFPNANNSLDLVFFLGCSPGWTKSVLDYIHDVIKAW
jgi:CDP-6-deoxy-D-xylo-4-hexulose-3-dehydrase